MKEWLASLFELCLYQAMQKLNPIPSECAFAQASHRPAALLLPPRLSCSPAGAKPEALNACRRPRSGPVRQASASDPVRPSPAAGTAGAVFPDGSGLQFGQSLSNLPCRTSIRTEDGTVILFDRCTGRAVSAPTREAAEARFARPGGG
ncbi:hypothetical protein GA829_15510 [Mesorhizobium sp. INR15]|nr:hypothetical protein GA829_15510 [Mesorhizobium sp. INR15]